MPSNWRDSDETGKAAWCTIEHTGVLDLGVGPADTLQLLLQGAGECVVDDVELIGPGGTNLIANGAFESGTSGWYMQGTHETSSWEAEQALHVRAVGRGDTGANRIRVSVPNPRPTPGQTATLRLRARWLCGTPSLLLRLRGNWLEASGRMALPAQPGTPGRANSRAAANAGPAIYAVSHAPVLPAAGQAVVVTARASDPDGIGAVNLRYRLDPAPEILTVPMTDDGKAGDAVAGDGIFSATIPRQAAGVMVAFHVEAVDGSAVPEGRVFPANAPTSECLFQFGDTLRVGSFGSYRLLLTGATKSRWTSRLKLHNGPLDATFVYGGWRAIYGMGAKYAGSPWIRPGYSGPTGAQCGYDFGFPEDDAFLGGTEMTMDFPTRDGTLQQEQVAYWMAEQLDLAATRRRNVFLYVNGALRGKLYEDCQRPSQAMLDQYYPKDADGDLFKLDDGFEFDSSATSFTRDNDDTAATLENFTTTGGVKKTARYRWHWRKRAEGGAPNDYARLFDLVDAVNSKNDVYGERVDGLVDVRQWMRVFALEHMVGNWDSYGYYRGKNMFAYKPTRGKWELLLWDIDFVMTAQGNPADSYMFSTVEPVISRMMNHPRFTRVYLQAMKAAVDGPLLAANVEPLLDAKYAALQANGISATSPLATKNYIRSRRNSLLATLEQYQATFTVSTNPGVETIADKNWVQFMGTAPLEVDRVQVNGTDYPVNWLSPTYWTVYVPLDQRTNLLEFRGVDAQGLPLAGSTATVQVSYTGPLEQPEDYVGFNEIMYRPATPGGEYVELCNRSTNNVFDLSRWRLDGLDFQFPSGTVIRPGAYLLVVEDLSIFQALYGLERPVAGQFAGKLRSDGETLRLLRPRAGSGVLGLVDEVSYASQAPWPAAAADGGASLQLIDPSQDHSRVGNWSAVSPDEAAHPRWRFVQVTGVATTNRLWVYHSPYQPPFDPFDLTGSWDGAIRFPGQEYAMSVSFRQSAEQAWTGTFDGVDFSTPLPVVAYTNRTVFFAFGADSGSPSWTGTLSADGRIQGVFQQTFEQNGTNVTQRYAFYLNRRLEPTVRGGDVYLDDLALVVGDVPGAGPNLIPDGDFESPLGIDWNLSPNQSASTVVTNFPHSGRSSLHLVASSGGDGQNTALWTDLPAVRAGQIYTLSYWYLPGASGNELTVRLADDSLSSVHSVARGQPVTPGERNSTEVAARVLPSLFLSEVVTDNRTVLADALGHRGPWLEVVNRGATVLDLSGVHLSDDYANLARWTFPKGAVIAPGQYRVVWLDGQVNETTADEWHASLSLSAKPGLVVLSQTAQGAAFVLDALAYPALGSDQSFGSPTSGGGPQLLFSPTPGRANDAVAPLLGVRINEWMASNQSTIAEPTTGQYADWIELYNPNRQEIDLAGYGLTDDPSAKFKTVFPAATRIGAQGFLLVWADGRDAASTPNDGAVHASFKLSQEGETIALYGPNGLLVRSSGIRRHGAGRESRPLAGRTIGRHSAHWRAQPRGTQLHSACGGGPHDHGNWLHPGRSRRSELDKRSWTGLPSPVARGLDRLRLDRSRRGRAGPPGSSSPSRLRREMGGKARFYRVVQEPQ